MNHIETKNRNLEIESQKPHVSDRSPAGWEPLILESNGEALKQLESLNRNNKYYLEQNMIADIQGVSNSLGAALAYVDDEFAEIFRANLSTSRENLLAMADSIREQAQEQGRTEFFVLAGMTGELVLYYNEVQKQLREEGREGLKSITERVPVPAFAKQETFEFELLTLSHNADLMLDTDVSKFSGAMMHSHALLINVYFTPDQKLRSSQEIDRILEYVDDALSIKSENYYWQGF